LTTDNVDIIALITSCLQEFFEKYLNNIQFGTPAGTYYIIIIASADANGDVPETNEANNTKYKKITITP